MPVSAQLTMPGQAPAASSQPRQALQPGKIMLLMLRASIEAEPEWSVPLSASAGSAQAVICSQWPAKAGATTR